MAKRKRPEQHFKSMRNLRSGRKNPGQFEKRATTLTVVDATKDADGLLGDIPSTQLFVPTDEQLEKINQFTLRRVTADEVACFTTHSCNDLIDRDDDKFSTKTVKGFATLEQPYSPVGKSFMVAHDTSKLGVGRIFDVGTKNAKTKDGDPFTMLTNDVYIPRISANETFIENMEFGINWAVSVGVLLNSATCQVGKEHEWQGMPWWCSKGHEKGLFYDPNSDEEDDWGWPLPVSEGSKGAMKCYRNFEGAKDMYELSMVYLGAQYMASVMDKDPTMQAYIKSAGAPVVPLGEREAKLFSFPTLPEKARTAAKNHSIKEEDGTFRWSGEDGLIWSFTPGEDTEPLLLGKGSNSGMTLSEINAKVQDVKAKLVEARGEMETKSTEGAAALASQLDGLLTQIDDALDQGDLDTANPIVDQAQNIMAQLFDELYENDNADDDDPNQDPAGGDNDVDDKGASDPEVKSHTHYHEHSSGTGHSHGHNHAAGNYDHGADDAEVAHDHGHDDKSAQGDTLSRKRILEALERRSSLPESLKSAISPLSEDSAKGLEILLDAFSNELDSLKGKASAGESYVKDLRAEVLDWYRKAHQDPKSAKGVDVSHIERLLDSVGDNVDVMKSLIEDYRSTAQARFGQSVRRSTVEPDQNNPDGKGADELKGDIESRIDGSRVSRIHG